MQPVRIIKKYPNRRLYDTKLGSYITLLDVKQLVFDQINFQVIDVRTQKDITQLTLLQIITEQETSSTPIFTTDVLKEFIRFYHEKSQDILSHYLEQAMHLFIQQKEFFNHQWQAYQTFLLDPNFVQQVLNMQKMWTKQGRHSDEKTAKVKTTPTKNKSNKTNT